MYEQTRKRRVEFRHYNRGLAAKQKDKNEKVPEHGYGWTVERGWFCGYGLDVVEVGETCASYTVAIIETDEGNSHLIPVGNFHFIP